MTDNEEGLAYSVVDGRISRVGLRRDGVGAPWIQKDWCGSDRYAKVRNMEEVWKHKPVWFESYASAKWMIEKKGWNMAAMVEWMASNHVTCVGCHPMMEGDAPGLSDLWHRIDMLAGARIVPISSVVTVGQDGFRVDLKAFNKGVARIALPYDVVFEVLDGNGNVVCSSSGCADPARWLPGSFEISEMVPVSEDERRRAFALRLRLAHRGGALRDFRFAAKGAENGLVVWSRDMP